MPDPDRGLEQATALAADLLGALGSVILGHERQLQVIVAGVLAGGHVLLEDAPGLGKTVLAKSLSRALGGTMSRIQGTADLLPSDVTGVTTWDQSTDTWRFRPGPVFHNIVLVDEINRATPRAQSALLEAMGEGSVTVDGTTHPLPRPFVVVATQNPTGDAGTYPLVAGQLDRFAVSVSLGLADRVSERALLDGAGGVGALAQLRPVCGPAALEAAIDATAGSVNVADPIREYVLDLVAGLRQRLTSSTPSTRAALTLLRVAKGHAVVRGRPFVAPDDVKAVAVAVLGHRRPAGDTGAGADAVRASLDATAVPLT